jgi:hypothetical protein
MTTDVNLLADLEKLGGAGYRGADRIRMLDAEVLELETQLAAYRKSEPEYQAQMKWARDVVSNVVIPPASQSKGGE